MTPDTLGAGFILACLMLLASTGALGILFAVAWIGVGVWFVANTNSRGFWADATFVLTWPLYLALEP